MMKLRTQRFGENYIVLFCNKCQAKVQNSVKHRKRFSKGTGVFAFTNKNTRKLH